MNFNHNLTETDIDNIDVKSQLEIQIQIQETKDSGWIFDKITSMKIICCKIGKLNGSNYGEIPLRSNAILYIENYDKYCFLWSILAGLRPWKNDHSNSVSNYSQYFLELNNDRFDF